MPALALTADGKIVTAREKGKAHGRHKTGVMNKIEAEHAWKLEAMKSSGVVEDYWFEAITFKLADDCRYTPDFMVMMADGSIEVHEIKGDRIAEDSTVKLRVAAAQFYPFRWRRFQRFKTGEWVEKEFSS